MSESDTEQKVGRDNLARMERNGWSFSQNDPQNPDAYTYVGVSSGGTPVWLLNEVASAALRRSRSARRRRTTGARAAAAS